MTPQASFPSRYRWFMHVYGVRKPACARPVGQEARTSGMNLEKESGYRHSGVPASAGSGGPGRRPRPRQASHRLKPGLPIMAYPNLWVSTVISRIRRSRQATAPRQASHRLKPGLPIMAYPDYGFQRSSAGSGGPGRQPRPRQASHRLKPGLPIMAYPNLWSSTVISRIKRSRQAAATPAGIPPAEAGTPDHGLSEPMGFNGHQPDQAVPVGDRTPAGIPPAEAGTPDHGLSEPMGFNGHQPDQAVPVGDRGPGRHPTG